jgi:hypothetical protein
MMNLLCIPKYAHHVTTFTSKINHVFYAANTRVTSELYKKKMAALGRSQSKRGGTRKQKPQQKEADSKKRAKKTEDDEFSSSDKDEE